MGRELASVTAAARELELELRLQTATPVARND